MMVICGAVNILLVLLLAPLLEGVMRKLTAKIQSRIGPPVLQPYYDLFKLLGKEDIESGETPKMQRFAAYLSLAAILTVVLLIPMGGPAPLNAIGDALLLVYLLMLCGIATLLAGLAAGSTYSLLGMSREMMTMMTLEPLLIVAIVASAAHQKSLRLDEALTTGAIYGHSGLPLAGIIMFGALLFSLQAFVGRLPFDTAEAETEIMEGPLMEYSGPKLALFKYARMIKLMAYAALFVALFAPWGNTYIYNIFYPLSVLILLAKVAALALFVTVVAATHARYRIDQAMRYYIYLFGISIVALMLAICGW